MVSLQHFEHPIRAPLQGVAGDVALFQAKLNVLHAIEGDALRGRVGLKLPNPQMLAHARDLERVQAKESTADVYAAAVLSEVVYKAVDIGHAQAEEAARRLEQLFPISLHLGSLDWSPPGQAQNYVVGETPEALVVAFLGTKTPGDLLASFNARAAQAFLPLGPEVAVHRGYLARTIGTPIEEFYQLAVARGKRLVLAGHSLGGAIATLAAIHLLCKLPPSLHHTVRAVGFATPPLGNAQLQSAVDDRGWAPFLRNYTLVEDWVPGALSLWRERPVPMQVHTAAEPRQPVYVTNPSPGEEYVCCGYSYAPKYSQKQYHLPERFKDE